ncbi:MAG TPA: MFS transporter [Phycisphaerae bacterium]|nr:MFS transporter [Phycisphaerae bacterium]
MAHDQDNSGVLRHVRHNFVVHALEGGLFLGGLTFVSGTTILPTIVQDLGGGDWLVARVPILMWAGLLLMPVFTAHRIERLHRYMPLLLVTGVFQRLPFLAAGLALLYLLNTSRTLVLATVVLAPLFSGIVCGISLTAWQQLLLRTLPHHRRSVMLGVRYGISCAIGIGAGWVVKRVLEAHPGAQGYGILHLCTFGMLVLGYILFAMVRETASPPPDDARPLGLRENLRQIPRLVRSEKRVKQYLVSRSLLSGIFIIMPFLAIYARQTLGETESFLGELLIVQTIGAAAGNLVGGVLGARVGGKAVLMASQIAYLVLAPWSAVAGTHTEFYAIFLLFGFAQYTWWIGTMTLSLEICPLRQRSTYLAVISFACFASMFLASEVSSLVWTGPERFAHLAALTTVTVALSLAFLVPLRDPRRDG